MAIESRILNPVLYSESGHRLRPEVREKLLEIVNEFLGELQEEGLEFTPIDVTVVGSQAGYNYTPTSDLDLHIVADFRRIAEECPQILGALFDVSRKLFNKEYDLTVKGIDVEVYVEDLNAGTRTDGIYSVLTDSWVVYPTPADIEVVSVEGTPDYLYFVSESERLISSVDVTSDEIDNFINDLYLQRKYALATEGEYSQGNQIFKKLRGQGYLDKLKDRRLEVRSRELSLESVRGKVIEVDG